MVKNEDTAASTRTKVLFAVYLTSGLAGLATTIFLVCIVALAALGRGPDFKFPAWPYVSTVLTMLVAKYAARLSYRRDEKQAHR